MAINGDGDGHFGPARHIRCAREHASRFVDPEPRRPLGMHESRLLNVEVAACLPTIHHPRAEVTQRSIGTHLITVLGANLGGHYRLTIDNGPWSHGIVG
ncbi:MAG: hypothetical protein RQ760_08815 [Sedimentisphaerales bacterium]|nr:hypothetical protein [Sedimentisphaerales bacterium]